MQVRKLQVRKLRVRKLEIYSGSVVTNTVFLHDPIHEISIIHDGNKAVGRAF